MSKFTFVLVPLRTVPCSLSVLAAVLELALVNKIAVIVSDRSLALKRAVDKVALQTNGIRRVDQSKFATSIPLSAIEVALKLEFPIQLFHPMTLWPVLRPTSLIKMVPKCISSNSLAFQGIILDVPIVVFAILEYFFCIRQLHLLVDRTKVKLLKLQFFGVLSIWICENLRILLLLEHKYCSNSETVWIEPVADGLVLPTLIAAQMRLGSGQDDLFRLRRGLCMLFDIISIDKSVNDQ